MKHKICLVCDDIFYKPKDCSYKKWENRKTCSINCKNEFKKTLIPWNKGIKYSEELKSKLNLYGLEKGRGLNKGKKLINFSGENHPNWKPKKTKFCFTCSKEMKLAKWELKRKFCSVYCWGLGHRGKNSPVFKGDKAVSKLRNIIAQLPEYRKWRLDILKRDNYKCIICIEYIRKNNPLEVDHIKKFESIILENNITNSEEARNCLQLWDINNGRTLCRTCHRKSDTYGTKKPIIN